MEVSYFILLSVSSLPLEHICHCSSIETSMVLQKCEDDDKYSIVDRRRYFSYALYHHLLYILLHILDSVTGCRVNARKWKKRSHYYILL